MEFYNRIYRSGSILSMGTWVTIEKKVLGRTLGKYDLDELSQFDELWRQKLFYQLV